MKMMGALIQIIGLSNVHLSEPVVASCDVAALASSIIRGLAFPSSSSTETICQDRSWKVRKCQNGLPAICADCQDPCNSADNAVNPFVVGDCGNPVSFPKATYLGMTVTSNAPVVSIVGLRARRSSIEVRVDVSADGIVRCGAFEKDTADLSVLEVAITAQNSLGALFGR